MKESPVQSVFLMILKRQAASWVSTGLWQPSTLIDDVINTVKFSNGQLNPAPSRLPKISLYNKTKDASKKKKIIVRLFLSMLLKTSSFPLPRAGSRDRWSDVHWY